MLVFSVIKDNPILNPLVALKFEKENEVLERYRDLAIKFVEFNKYLVTISETRINEGKE